MSVFCICGVCVPYSIFWPFLLIILKPIFEYIQKVFGIEKKKVEGKAACSSEPTCCNVKQAKRGTFNLTDSDDWSALSSSTDLTFIRFTASWCAPCKKIEPFFLSCGAQYSDKNFITIDVDEFDEIAASYAAFAIPLFVAIRGGKEVGRMSGKEENELREFIRKTAEKEPLE
jgi:thiol-disulfide isomerase/thioredoxin